jgi:adenine-specific DNA-methyltransferase
MTASPVMGADANHADVVELRKARGAFFTPVELCDYLCRWAIRHAADRVLEPSCGEAAFLLAAARRLDQLGAPADPRQLVGVELHPDSALAARELVAAVGRPTTVTVGDFFAEPGERRFDAVVGNPPYVRYQGFTGADRVASRRAALRGGVGLTALASSWAAFTVHAAEFLRPGGRLGLVLPAELLTVNYAAEVRRYLMARFGRVRLVVFTERVFPGVLEEVVLLLAEDALAAGGTDHCELHQVATAADLGVERAGDFSTRHRWRPGEAGRKWTPALLSSAAPCTGRLSVAPGSPTCRPGGRPPWGR